MEIGWSARKHSILDEDIRHALRVPLRLVRQEGADRVLVIGADRNGTLLEVVVMDPEGEPLVIHADKLRSKFYTYL